MNHLKEFKLENGLTAQIIIRLYISSINEEPSWQVNLAIRQPKKRNWVYMSQSDNYTWRALSMDDRIKSDWQMYLKYVTIEQINETALELHEMIKPKFV